MLPLRDTTGHRRGHFPYAVILLIALNFLVFIWELALPRPWLEDLVITYGLVPSVVAAQPLGLLPSGIPVLGSLITSLFLHSGAMHLAGNMIFLWVFGDNLEDTLGHLTFLGVYLLAGIGAALAHVVAFHGSSVPSVGASGAVAGVLAGYLLLFPRATVRTLLLAGPFVTLGRVRAMLLIGLWAVVQFLQGLVSVHPLNSQSDGVGYVAHVGGFITGAGLVAGICAVRDVPFGHFEGALRWGWLFRNWAVAAGLLGLLVLLTPVLSSFTSPQTAQIVQGALMSLIAVFALADGVRRLTGHGSPLATGGRSRGLLAALQILLAVGLLATTLLTLALV